MKLRDPILKWPWTHRRSIRTAGGSPVPPPPLPQHASSHDPEAKSESRGRSTAIQFKSETASALRKWERHATKAGRAGLLAVAGLKGFCFAVAVFCCFGCCDWLGISKPQTDPNGCVVQPHLVSSCYCLFFWLITQLAAVLNNFHIKKWSPIPPPTSWYLWLLRWSRHPFSILLSLAQRCEDPTQLWSREGRVKSWTSR